MTPEEVAEMFAKANASKETQAELKVQPSSDSVPGVVYDTATLYKELAVVLRNSGADSGQQVRTLAEVVALLNLYGHPREAN